MEIYIEKMMMLLLIMSAPFVLSFDQPKYQGDYEDTGKASYHQGNRLLVHVLAARGLNQPKLPNPYVQMNLGGDRMIYTTVRARTSNPTWNQRLEILLGSKKKTAKNMDFKVMSLEDNSQLEIGSGSLNIKSALNSSNRWSYHYDLPIISKGSQMGSLHVGIIYLPQGSQDPLPPFYIAHEHLKINGVLSTMRSAESTLKGTLDVFIDAITYPKGTSPKSHVIQLLLGGHRTWTSSTKHGKNPSIREGTTFNLTFFAREYPFPVLEVVTQGPKEQIRGQIDLLDLLSQPVNSTKRIEVYMTGNYPETKYPKITLTVKFTRYIPSVQISKRFTVEYMEKGVKKTRYEDRKVWEILDDKEYDRYLEDRKTRQRLYYDILKAISAPKAETESNVGYLLLNIPFARNLRIKFGESPRMHLSYTIQQSATHEALSISCPSTQNTNNPNFECAVSIPIRYTQNMAMPTAVISIHNEKDLVFQYRVDFEAAILSDKQWITNGLQQQGPGYAHVQAGWFWGNKYFAYPEELVYEPFIYVGIVNARGGITGQVRPLKLTAQVLLGKDILYTTLHTNTANPNWKELTKIQLDNRTDLKQTQLQVHLLDGHQVIRKTHVKPKKIINAKGKWAINGMVPLFSDGKTKSGSIYLQIGMFTKRDIILPPIIQAPLMDLFPSRPFYGKMEGTILLYIISGRGLRATNTFSEGSDSFVEMHLGKKKLDKTKTIKKSSNPEYNELFEIGVSEELVNELPRLKLKIYNHNTIGKNDYLGGIELEIGELVSDRNRIVWDESIELRDHHQKAGSGNPVTGSLYIRGCFLEGSVPKASILPQMQSPVSLPPKPLQFQDMSPRVEGRLFVRVSKGYDLAKGDAHNSDSYAKIKVGGKEKGKTKTITSLNPNWGYEKEIPLDAHLSNLPELYVEVYDKDTLSDDYLGKAKIPLLPVVTSPGTLGGGFLPLTDHKGRAKKDSPAKGFLLAQVIYISNESNESKDYIPNFGVLREDDVRKGKVEVKVVKATGIKAGDNNGGSDAYCKVKWGNEIMLKTKVVTSLNPSWGQSIQIPVVFLANKGVPQFRITVELWDRDRMSSDDYLGEISVQMHEIAQHGTLDREFPLRNVDNKNNAKDGPVTGTLHLLFNYH